MQYKCEVNSSGFIVPDFDFESDNPVFPISTPSNNTYKFDVQEHFALLKNALSSSDKHDLCRQLGFFKAAIISNASAVESDDFPCEEVSLLLFDLINPKQDWDVLYEVICTSVALTGVNGRASIYFGKDYFVRFMIRVIVISLSDPNFGGRRELGQAALAFLRNLIYNDNSTRIFFIKEGGIELVATLYFELSDYQIKNHIIWVLLNSLDVVPSITLDMGKPLELFFKSIFGYSLPAESIEVQLCLKYVMINDDFALNFINLLDLNIVSSNFIKASDEVQVELLNLFGVLILHNNNRVSETSFKNIKWNSFIVKIPDMYSNKVKKKLCEFAEKVFIANTTNTKLLFETEMFPSLVKMINYGKYSVRLKALKASSKIIHTKCEYVIESILGNHMIEQILHFLETDWPELIKFGLEFLITLLDFALNRRYKKEIIIELNENDVQSVVNSIIERKLPEEINELCYLLRTKIDILYELEEYSDFYDEEEPNERITKQITDNNEYIREEEEENVKNDVQSDKEESEEEDIEWIDAEDDESI